MSEAAAQYKKINGKITVSADGRTVSWKATDGKLAVDVDIAAITNLQQTPATSAKASIKVVVQQPDQTENHTFTFTSAAAREDQQAITGLLRKCIEDCKARSAAAATASTATPTPAPDNGGASAAMTIAQTLVGTPKEKQDTYDDAKLLEDIALQRSLLNSNPALRHRFDQALRDKPDSISIIQFSNQFWATRAHLLRSHAVEKSQGAGTYNVLSVVKPVMDGSTEKLNMSKEQIQLIFSQHPLVKKIYNETVPPLKEVEFWQRFFRSRLIKKLRGERISELDPTDPKLDKFLNFNESADDARQLVLPSVPHFLDIEGNEQNHSQRLGNRPDSRMRPSTNEKVPILRVLNRMSEKMMAEVPPSDVDPHAPAGMDEDTYKELQLRDLQRAADDNRVVLNLQDQSQLFSAGQGVHTSSSAATYAKRTPAQVLSIMQQQFRNIADSQAQNGGINLQLATGAEDDSSSDEEADVKKKSKVGSRSSRVGATSQVVKAIRQRQRHNDDYLSAAQAPLSSEQARKLGLSEQVFDNLAMTHNTTVEFLHYFWAVYYSGDAERANEVAKLIETLDKSLDRIKAVADTAENERNTLIQAKTREIETYMQKSGRKRKFDPNSIKGGARVVNRLVEPLVRAIGKARQQYQSALQEQLQLQSQSRVNAAA